MSVNFDESMYVNAMTTVQQAQQIMPPPPTSTNEDNTKVGGMDSYIPNMPNYDTPMPTGTYGANGMMINDIPMTSQISDIDNPEEITSEFMNRDVDDASVESINSQGGGSSGGSSGSSSNEETTKIVTINGIQYLETTTIENGVTKTTRTPLSSSVAAESIGTI